MRPLTDNAEGDDVPNRDLHTSFSVWEHDPGFDTRRKTRDVVVDGNQVMTRKLLPDEMLFRGNPAGRPKTAVQKKPSRTTRRPAEPTSRCVCVSQVEAHAAKMNP